MHAPRADPPASTRQREGPLRALFEPRSIAVVGASTAPEKAGYQMLATLRAFPGLVAVNPGADEILGVPTVPSLGAIPGPVDLAVLTVPPAAVPGVLRDGAAAGLRAAVICAGGFAEAGVRGAALQDEVAALASEAGIRVLGPNTSGFVNPAAQVHAVFLPAAARLPAGGLAVVAQSGGVNLALSLLAREAGMGLRLAVGLGNAVDVGFADVLDHLAEDTGTEVVVLHVEGVRDGEALCRSVERLSDRVPVVALKVGRADVTDFARSHTGALTGDWALARAALSQAGAVVVDDVTEALDAARALASGRAAPRAEPGVGVVTGQAGPGLLIADTLRSAGVSLPTFAADTVERIGSLLPPLTFQRNPIDTGRPTPSFGDVVAAVAADAAVDAVCVYALHEPGAFDLADALGDALGDAEAGVPLVCGTGGLADDVDEVRKSLRALGLPVYTAPERAARAARALAADSRARFRVEARRRRPPVPTGRRLDPAAMDEDAAKTLLARWGVPVPERRVCATRVDAHAALADLGGPLVAKVLDAAITHKSDVGGVHQGVTDVPALDTALDAIDRAGTGDHRYLLERMAPAGAELIVGGTRDLSFGPALLVGIGGLAVEALRLIALRRAPLSVLDAHDLLDELPGRPLLEGYRGLPPADLDALAEVIVRVGDLLVAHEEIAELDVNPLRMTAEGPLALDALVVLRADS